MAISNRIAFYNHSVNIAPFGSSTYTMVHGAQSAGLNLSFSLNQIFELGQLSIYENVEDLPQVELSLEKVLDGYTPIYLLCTTAAANPTLAGRSSSRANVQMGLWRETDESATGSVPTLRQVLVSGAYVSSVQYSFPVDSPLSESVTLVANDLFWKNTSGAPASFPNFDTTFLGGDSPLASNGSGGVNQRENIIFNVTATGVTELGVDTNGVIRDWNCTVLPRDIPGINGSGMNGNDSDGYPAAKIQSITVNVDFGREDILQLGVKGPFYRFLQVPTEVTTSIDVHNLSGSNVSASSFGVFAGAPGVCTDRYNLLDNTIRITTCEGLRLYLGKKNKLTSINDQGGDTGGGNRTTTYSYSNFNDFTVGHYNDPNWTLRPQSGSNGVTYFSPQ